MSQWVSAATLPSSSVHIIVGPVVGEVTATSAIILLEVDSTCSVGVHLLKGNEEVRSLHLDFPPQRPHAFCLSDLDPGTSYEVLFSNVARADIRDRTARFRTLPEQPSQVRIVALSCDNPAAMQLGDVDLWERILEWVDRDEVDVVLHLGDQVYTAGVCDECLKALAESHGGPHVERRAEEIVVDHLRDLYRKSWNRPAVRRVLASTSHIMTWGDGDIAPDFTASWPAIYPASVSARFVQISRRIYREYQRQLWDLSSTTRPEAPSVTAISQQLRRQLLLRGRDMTAHGNLHSLGGENFEITTVESQMLSEHEGNEEPQSEFHFHRWGNVGLFCMDVRGNRVSALGRPLPRNPRIGDTQWAALQHALDTSRLSTLIITSELPFVTYQYDEVHQAAHTPGLEFLKEHWAYNFTELHQFLRMVLDWKKRLPAREILLLSGDLHCGCTTSIQDVLTGTTVTQLITSPITNHVSPFPAAFNGLLNNRWQYHHSPLAQQRNVAVINIDCTSPLAGRVDGRLVGTGQKISERRLVSMPAEVTFSYPSGPDPAISGTKHPRMSEDEQQRRENALRALFRKWEASAGAEGYVSVYEVLQLAETLPIANQKKRLSLQEGLAVFLRDRDDGQRQDRVSEMGFCFRMLELLRGFTNREFEAFLYHAELRLSDGRTAIDTDQRRDVLQWLRKRELDHYAPILFAHDFTSLAAIRQIEDSDLLRIGITKVGAVRKLQNAVFELRHQHLMQQLVEDAESRHTGNLEIAPACTIQENTAATTCLEHEKDVAVADLPRAMDIPSARKLQLVRCESVESIATADAPKEPPSPTYAEWNRGQEMLAAKERKRRLLQQLDYENHSLMEVLEAGGSVPTPSSFVEGVRHQLEESSSYVAPPPGMIQRAAKSFRKLPAALQPRNLRGALQTEGSQDKSPPSPSTPLLLKPIETPPEPTEFTPELYAKDLLRHRKRRQHVIREVTEPLAAQQSLRLRRKQSASTAAACAEPPKPDHSTSDLTAEADTAVAAVLPPVVLPVPPLVVETYDQPPSPVTRAWELQENYNRHLRQNANFMQVLQAENATLANMLESFEEMLNPPAQHLGSSQKGTVFDFQDFASSILEATTKSLSSSSILETTAERPHASTGGSQLPSAILRALPYKTTRDRKRRNLFTGRPPMFQGQS
eukprot:TRINITY_DN9115_c0_g1_i1.p1 TRINITY_DN9115_c0_g1~~TRINITY_DN9115_c0_g1_i1.p1  ORF type:complete len:1163 (-),score=165.57 TRINITY_DN9115_c0_g1_i1:14-3502(-)